MSKNTIKKIILTIIILSVLILTISFFYRITSEDYKEDISIVKKIIGEDYSQVHYYDDSNYLCAYQNGKFVVFDYNGNKLYSFYGMPEEKVESVSKKYYIKKINNIYYLYNSNSEKIASGNYIYPLNDYLIYKDKDIINTKGEVLFAKINRMTPHYKNKYFTIDNNLIDAKGKILLNGYNVEVERINDNELDYFILKKGNSYYSFFPLVNNIVGDEFEKYFEYKNELYIVSNNKIYKIFTNGLRKEVSFNIDKNIYKVDYLNAVRKNRLLTIRDYYLGILETDTNKFHRITKTKKYTYKYLDSNHISISCNGKNYVYDLNKYKVIYEGNYEDIIIFKNNYKTIKSNNMYYLLDKKDRVITFSDKQIILLNSKIEAGKPNEDIVLFDNNNTYYGKSFIIQNKTYYQYEKDNTKYIVSKNLKEKFDSELYLNHMNDTIVYLKGKTLYFYNIKNNKTYTYNIRKYKIQNDEINKNEVILSDGKNIIVLNRKGRIIKKIRNVRIKDIYYSEVKQAIIIIEKKPNGSVGAYVLK